MKFTLKGGVIILVTTIGVICTIACRQPKNEAEKPSITEVRNMEGQELADRGLYLSIYGGCNHCHTPKIMGPNGPADDTTRLLSGYPHTATMQPFDAAALKPGSYVLGTPDLTAWVGPWGISYASNLTPDSTTGMGGWDEDVFIKTMRTGKHLGQENGRQILPPMPWYDIGKLTDNDLKALYAYLRTIPAIKNAVPAPVPPNEAMAMAGK